MGFFDIFGTALSVATTIGKVAGALSGALDDELVHVGRVGAGNINEELGQVVFWRDKPLGDLMAINQTTVSGVELFFPGNPYGGPSGQVVYLGKEEKIPVGHMFSEYSNADVDDLVITPFVDGSSARAAGDVGNGGPTGVSIQASGQNITPKARVRLGTSIEVEGSDTTVQIAVLGGLVLAGIVVLNVRGAGTTVARIMNVLRKPKPSTAADDDTSMTVEMPQGVDIANGISYIDMVLAVQGKSPAASTPVLASHPDAVPLTDEDVARLTAFTSRR